MQKHSADCYQSEKRRLALCSGVSQPWVPDFPQLALYMDLPLNVISTKVIGSTASLRAGYLLIHWISLLPGLKGLHY